jgi:hypothetical protein
MNPSGRPIQRFRVGDVVRCTRLPNYSDLVIGNTYTVNSAYYYPGGSDYPPSYWVVVNGTGYGHQEDLFEAFSMEEGEVASGVRSLVKSRKDV